MMGEAFVSGGKPGKAGSHQAKPSTKREPRFHGDLWAGMGGLGTNLVESQKSHLAIILGGKWGVFCLFLLLCHVHEAKMRWVPGLGWLLGGQNTFCFPGSISINRNPWDLLLQGHPSKQELLEFPLEQQWMGNASDPGMEMWSHVVACFQGLVLKCCLGIIE